MINLIPSALKQTRKYGRRNHVLLTYSISLLVTAGFIILIMMLALQQIRNNSSNLQSELDRATAEVAALEGDVVEIEKIAERFETAKKLKDDSIRFSELLPDIGAALPEGVILNALSLTGGITDPLLLDVDIRSADLAPTLLRNLTDSDLFEAADISSLTPRGASDDTTTDDQYRFNASVLASFTGTSDAKKASDDAAAAQVQDPALEAQQGAQ